jgi:multiple sugar transport system permease protein
LFRLGFFLPYAIPSVVSALLWGYLYSPSFGPFAQIASSLHLPAPGFVTVLLFSFVATWNNYFLPLLVLSDPTYYPLTLGLASWNAQASANGGAQLLFTLVLTGSLISILPLIVAFLFLQRYWQGGLTLGSIRS